MLVGHYMRFCFYFILFLFLEVIVMAYVAPTVRSAGDAVTAADYNIMANDVIAIYDSVKRLDHQTLTGTYSSTSSTMAGAADIFASDLSWSADGASTYILLGYYSYGYTGTDLGASKNLGFVKGDGSNIKGLVWMDGQNNNTSYRLYSSGFFQMHYLPTAGTQTVNMRSWHSGSNTNNSAIIADNSGQAEIFMSVYGPVMT
jgi:hypothetical protein